MDVEASDVAEVVEVKTKLCKEIQLSLSHLGRGNFGRGGGGSGKNYFVRKNSTVLLILGRGNFGRGGGGGGRGRK